MQRKHIPRVYEYQLSTRKHIPKVYKYQLSTRKYIPRLYEYQLSTRKHIPKVYKYQLSTRKYIPENIMLKINLFSFGEQFKNIHKSFALTYGHENIVSVTRVQMV